MHEHLLQVIEEIESGNHLDAVALNPLLVTLE
jgi:hypothetical protein